MAKLLKLRRGTTSQHSSFTGAEGEVTVDTDKETLVVHNGSSWVITASAGLAELSEDSSPELGGHLDCNDKNLTEVATVSGDNLQIDFGTIA